MAFVYHTDLSGRSAPAEFTCYRPNGRPVTIDTKATRRRRPSLIVRDTVLWKTTPPPADVYVLVRVLAMMPPECLLVGYATRDRLTYIPTSRRGPRVVRELDAGRLDPVSNLPRILAPKTTRRVPTSPDESPRIAP